jgi:hypothetical protein
MTAKYFTCALLISLGGWLLPARGEDLRTRPVRVCVVTILATTRKEPVDKRLTCIAKEVQKKDKTLRGFKLIDMNCVSLVVGAPHKFKLLDKQEVVVVIRHGADKNNWVELKVKPPLQGDITYRTVCGKCLPIITGYKTKNQGDRLILAIMVKPCHKKK